MRIDATPSHRMQCAPVDEPSINVAMIAASPMSPGELAVEMSRLAGRVRRGEAVDGAHVVALLRCAAEFLNTTD